MSISTLGVAVLSLDALLVRLIQSEAMVLLFWRGILLSFSVYLWMIWQHRSLPHIRMDLALLRSAGFYAASSVFFVLALYNTSAANVLVIISIQPLLAAVLSSLVLHEHARLHTWLALFVVSGGIILVMHASWQSDHLGGDILALLCAFAISAKFVNDRQVCQRNMTPSLVIAGLFLAIIGLLAKTLNITPDLTPQPGDWPVLLLLCAVVIPLAFVLISIGPMLISATELSMVMLLETVLGPVWVWLVLQESPARETVLAGLIIVSTLLFHASIRLRHERHLESLADSE